MPQAEEEQSGNKIADNRKEDKREGKIIERRGKRKSKEEIESYFYLSDNMPQAEVGTVVCFGWGREK